MRHLLPVLTVCFALSLTAPAQEGPFGAAVSVTNSAEGKVLVAVGLTVPPGHYLYAEQVSVEGEGKGALLPHRLPVPQEKYDELFGKNVRAYDHDVTLLYALQGDPPDPLYVSVAFQGCDSALCYPPEKLRFVLRGGQAVGVVADDELPEIPVVETEPASWQEKVAGFTVAGRAAGYLDANAFTRFLDSADSGEGMAEGTLVDEFRQKGVWFTIVAVILGGLLLNLTPCVLPMIPINIAIIGAGAQAGSRTRGFLLGGTYGLGIALVYGLLGVVVVLTGSQFGTINSSPLFNLAVAVLFFVLSLAMFGVFNLDLSRFQGGGSGRQSNRGPFVTALLFGGIAAMLAGACVAPVLIGVLAFSAELYAGGNRAGLVLPFVLGLGMALPWPFAGAGLSFLPKPGAWMERVKKAFGVVIILAACWYAWVAVGIFRGGEIEVKEGWHTSLEEGLDDAAQEGKPLFIDFWASWCKNCLKMEKTTFVDPDVGRRLDAYVRLKLRAEDLKDPATKAILDHFGAKGLPTYVVLVPKED
jgi:thioredoxin:protein disulfide reductase